MKPHPPCFCSGAALIVTLILVTAISLVVVSFFAVTRQEAETSTASVSRARAELGERAAFEEAGSLLRSLTADDSYHVNVVLRSGDGAMGPTRYTFVSRPDRSGVTHTPLFSGGGGKRVDLPNLNDLATADLASGPVAAPDVAFEAETGTGGIALHRVTHLSGDGTTFAENPFPETGFRELSAPSGSPYRTRYSYWIEDLEGYPNLDAVGTASVSTPGPSGEVVHAYSRFGYSRFDSRVPTQSGGAAGSGGRLPLEGESSVFFQFPAVFRDQVLTGQVAPGLSTREINLLPWTTGPLPLAEHPFYDPGSSLAESHFVPRHAKQEAGRFSVGLKPYRSVPMIPFAHGYEDEGLPRHNLNTLVAARDLAIAGIVERNLPSFALRKGGFPAEEDYVATLAANAIDYADTDCLPSVPSNTSNSGGRSFRGTDGYAPVNELFVRFEYRGYEDHATEWKIVFVATVYAEFWNTFNREVAMETARLKFRFLEPIGFKTNSQVYRIEESHLDRDEPLEAGATFSIPPNGHLVHRFGDLRWKVPVQKSPTSPIAFPLVQDIRADLPGGADTRAHYELWLGGTLQADREWAQQGLFVDSSSRKGEEEAVDYGFFFPRHGPVMKLEEHFMRLSPGNGAVLGYGFNPPKGSHLGDPWMNYYSRSTVESAQYRFKASPGARNFDRDKVKASRPDWFKDQTRVRAWPDRGYDTPALPGPVNDGELPDLPNFAVDQDPAFAPWRLSQLGIFHSVTELGNLHDPVMWTYGPPSGADSVITKQSTQLYNNLRDTWLRGIQPEAGPSPIWGGGNTLRIGRPEHPLFDQPGMRASQWLDLFHTGYTGTNLPAAGNNEIELYRHHDPRHHQPPPAAPDPVESMKQPYAMLYDPDLNASGRFSLVYGHLNLNSAPTLFEIETLLRGPFVSSDLRLAKDDFRSPTYAREGDGETLQSGLRPEAIPKIAADLYRSRPFYSPSHLARVLSHLIEQHKGLPDHHNDAEAEETFARVFNTTSLSSRHFRVFTYAEVYHNTTGEVAGRTRRVYEVFLRPVRGISGEVESSKLEVISSRDL